MNAPVDETAPVRLGEELPVEPLAAYLADRLPGAAGPLSVEQFPRGHSNLTYLLRFGERELVLRRPPFGNTVHTAHDMGREYRVLARLHAVFDPAPEPYLYCDDPAVIGAPFYVMERRCGLILRGAAPAGVNIDPPLARGLSCTLIDGLAALHALDYAAAGLAELGKPAGYVERQVRGWTKRWHEAQTADVPAMDRAARWLAEDLPAESGAAVIHNDFKYDNLVLDAAAPTRLLAVLDWEMATIGDPLLDLGTSLGYWVQADDDQQLRRAAFGPTALPGSLTRQELVERYERQTGHTVPHPAYYYCFGLFKLAVIVQQIYARYVRGHTSDPRFARLDALVEVVAEQAVRALETGRL